MNICCFSNGLLSFFTYVILTNVSNGANFCMKLPYFMKEISIFAPKPCILRNLRSKRERSGFSLLNLTVLITDKQDFFCKSWKGGVLCLDCK